MALQYTSITDPTTGKTYKVLAGSPEEAALKSRGATVAAPQNPQAAPTAIPGYEGSLDTFSQIMGRFSGKNAADADFFQQLSGGSETNPYLPYLRPTVVTKDGKQYLRIPKNQQLLNLAKYFDSVDKSQFTNTRQLAQDFIRFQDQEDSQKLGWAKEERIVAKENKPKAPKSEKVPAVSTKKTASGGIAFFQTQKDGTKKPITAAQYVASTGQNIRDVLSQSEDENDAKIVDEMDQLEEAVKEGTITEEEAVQSLQADYPWVFDVAK